MRFIKLISAVCLAFTLCACQSGIGGTGGGQNAERASSCIFETEDYALRVVRGEKRLEFTSPELLCGAYVVFDGEGKCTLCYGVAQNGDETNNDNTSGVSIPLEDERGWLDWLVAAYPEDWLDGEQNGGGAFDVFSLNGADFSIEDGSKCTITRAGVSRSAIRSDE